MDLLKIAQHPLFGAGLSILGIIGGYILYRLGRREKKPLWSIKNNNLISGFSKRVPNLEIKYSDQNIETLSVCKVVFWNSASETIRRDDIAEADPLAIVLLNNAKLLDASLLAHNSMPSQFLIYTKPEINSTFLSFDFVDKDQGAVVQVIHTGAMLKDVDVKGTIKGAGTPRQNPLDSSFLWFLTGLITYFGSILAIALVGAYFIYQLDLNHWMLIPAIIIALLIPVYVLREFDSWGLRRIPKDLRSHF
jgi:hypothetical protein